MSQPDQRARLRPGALVPAVLGLAFAIYLTVEHYTPSTTLACPESATVNCQKVTTSSYSHVLGIPVALLGAVYFVVMTVLVLPPAWRAGPLRPVRLLGAVVGMISVLYLVWAELFQIGAICLYCTAVHVCTLALFGGVLWYSIGTPDTEA